MSTPKTAPRTRYHHGDLRNAMVQAAVELARTGGPEAVVLREVARRVGVSPTAAYRHFSDADALLNEVRRVALGILADSIFAAVGTVPDDGDPGDVAVAWLRASAEGYIDFAVGHPCLFLTAFCRTSDGGTWDDGESFAETEAFQALRGLLDQVVATGRMPAERRAGADIAAWSAVHGFAGLLVDGVLNSLSPQERALARERALDVIVRGLVGSD